MALSLEEVKNERDFDDFFPMLYAAFLEPYNSLTRWFYPVHTTVEAAVEAAKWRSVGGWKQNDDCYWLKVTDTASGNIVGAAEWVVNREVANPREAQQPIDASWHIEKDDEKAFASKLLTSLRGFMKERITGPHLELGLLVTHPDHRGRGVGRLLVSWGKQKADELGLESCVESVPFAVPIYEKLGYGNVASLEPDVSIPNPSAKWKEYAAEDLRVCCMWRPVGHDYRAGVDKFPRFRG